jgi:hypothetical protein
MREVIPVRIKTDAIIASRATSIRQNRAKQKAEIRGMTRIQHGLFALAGRTSALWDLRIVGSLAYRTSMHRFDRKFRKL